MLPPRTPRYNASSVSAAQNRPAFKSTSRADRTAYSMRALGKSELPASIVHQGTKFRRTRTVKHDFFAATGFYENPQGKRIVLKISRTQDFAGLPLVWLGRWLCRREQRFYRKLDDLENVPNLLGAYGETGFIIEYVDGEPLSRGQAVPDRFFDELEALIGELHRRGLAYVDANKRQNLLVGRDGHPHLIDFQISGDRTEFGGIWPHSLLIAHLQGSDCYHLLKHKRRLRPDLLTKEERERIGRKSFLLRVHRLLFKPYFKLRRRTFQRLRHTGRLLPEGSK